MQGQAIAVFGDLESDLVIVRYVHINIFWTLFFLPDKVNGHILGAVYFEVRNYPCKGHLEEEVFVTWFKLSDIHLMR
jgi:hypothetical protein